MIRLEFDGLTIDAPIERRMSVEEFLSIADRLERIAGRSNSAMNYHDHDDAHHIQHLAHSAHSMTPTEMHYTPQHQQAHSTSVTHEDMRFEHEDAQRLEYFMERLAKQLAKLEETHLRLERIERAMVDHGIHPRK